MTRLTKSEPKEARQLSLTPAWGAEVTVVDSRALSAQTVLEETIALYGIRNWGSEYFRVNDNGEVVCAFPTSQPAHTPLKDLVTQLGDQGIATPVVLRFPQIIQHQLNILAGAFESAIKEFGYRKDYIPAYPIKVNQKKEVVRDVLRFGDPYQVGLEVGSKAELAVALALTHNRHSPIICNGVKDVGYIKLALIGTQIGKRVFIVVESIFELHALLAWSQRFGVRPRIGLRLKLSARGSGKWEKSSGDLSKFGFTTTDLLKCIRSLREADMLDCLSLLHFHIGSQVTEIRRVKYAVKEAARTYAKLRQFCPQLTCLDVGGGLGH